MRVDSNHPLVNELVVHMPDPKPDSPHRLKIIGILKAADNIEGWVDQYQGDGSVKRIHGTVHFTWHNEYLYH